jgi:hypothetical protein
VRVLSLSGLFINREVYLGVYPVKGIYPKGLRWRSLEIQGKARRLSYSTRSVYLRVGRVNRQFINFVNFISMSFSKYFCGLLLFNRYLLFFYRAIKLLGSKPFSLLDVLCRVGFRLSKKGKISSYK